MDMKFEQVELLQTASLNPHSMRLLPRGKKKMQKLVIGDTEGVLASYSIRKGEPVSVFRNMPLPHPILRVELGGNRPDKHKIFAATGAAVRAYTKKGKEFFQLETNLTEPIRSMFVEGNGIWTGGEYIYNHFRDGQDFYFYAAPDRINDLTCDFVSGGIELDAILACQDRNIRVVHKSELFYSHEVDGPVTAVHTYLKNDAVDKHIVYGTGNGHIGIVGMQPMKIYSVSTVRNEKRLGGIQCVYSTDVTGDGVNDIIVGRDDGSVELYAFNMGDATPQQRFHAQIAESVTSIQAGFVANPAHPELVCASYSGRVISFTSELSSSTRRDSEFTAHRTSAQKEKKVKALKAELQKLQDKLEKQKGVYGKLSTEHIAQKAQSSLKHHFGFAEDGVYTFVVELDAPIDVVCLQADVPIELLDVSDNSTIVSVSPPDPENKNVLLATYRCQEPNNRLQIKFRTFEGQYGVFQAYVIPLLAPKTCQSVQYIIKPLSQHSRIGQPSEEDQKRPLNELKLNGNFSLGEIHSWVSLCLPEIPERTPSDEVNYWFKSAFLGTILSCDYRKGEAVFLSDNISTLALVKEVITKEATRRNITVSIHFTLNDKSIPHFLALMHPLLDHQFALSRQVQLIDAVKEIQAQGDDAQFLSPELRHIADNASTIQKEFEQQPRRLEQLYAVVTDLYIDLSKFKGVNVKQKVPQLQQLLLQYSPDTLLAFFVQP